MKRATYVIIGGGIAGISCAQGLAFLSPSEQNIILISATPQVKIATNVKHLTKMLCEFDVDEKNIDTFQKDHPNIYIIENSIKNIDIKHKQLYLDNGDVIEYEKLCICSGAKPKMIFENHPHVIGIRDVDSVKDFQKRLARSKRIVIIGNGGIATELAYEIHGMEVIWVIKDKHITATFIDPGAAQFFTEKIYGKLDEVETGPIKRLKYKISDDENDSSGKLGAALGPDWHSNIDLQGLFSKNQRQITIEYNTELKRILPENEIENNEWPVYVELTNGKIFGCDFIVSAIGVKPCVDFLQNTGIELCQDGGIKVDWKLESNIKDVYAAGDCCTAAWNSAEHWLQMRLWTQAKQMGTYAAKSMFCSKNNQELWQDFSFELFTHVTKFFNMKVILLGLFNGQRLNNDYELLLRVTKNHEYIKLILKNGRLQGAVLIGDTDLEEMCENLILNQLDLTDIADDLLDPNLDIDDYFD